MAEVSNEKQVSWICSDCSVTFYHPSFVIQHVVEKHLGGSASMVQVNEHIIVKVD